MKTRAVLIILLLLVFAGVGWFYLAGKKGLLASMAAANSEVPVLDDRFIAKVERRNLVQTIETSGDIQPATQVDIKAEVSGRIKRLFVLPGQKVNAGDPLVELDDHDLLTAKSSADINVQGTKFNLDKAKRNFDRAKQLFQSNLVSQEFFDNAKTEMEIAQNDFDRAQTSMESVVDQLAKTKICSPFSGTILSIPVVEGQVVVGAASVNNGTLLMTLADLSDMMILAQVNQVDIAYISKGQKGEFTVESIPDTKMVAEVGFISPMASIVNNLKGFPVKIFITNPDHRLRPGMTADVALPVSTSKNALSVPISAVFSDDGTNSIVYVAKDPTAIPKKQPVTLGIVNYDYAEIKCGVSEGEVVLLKRPTMIKGG